MALDDDIRILSGVGLFEELSPEQLRLLAFGAENMRLRAGRDLYREGQKADCAFVVARGKVSLYREREGERQVLALLGDGAIMGELALIADTRRLTSAHTEVETDVIRLNRTLFRRILEEYPELAMRLHRRISADLEKLLVRIAELSPRFS